MSDVPLDPVAIDVSAVLQGTITSLHAHLVTRPTGRAVRTAIEARIEGAGSRSLSLIDLSDVTVLDFSCADEVVAKLLQKYEGAPDPEVFFVFRGVHEPHRDQVEYVLERQGLAAVAETAPGAFELLGERSAAEDEAWRALEIARVMSAEVSAASCSGLDRDALGGLLRRRVAFRSPVSGRVHALSYLVDRLLERPSGTSTS